MDVLGIITGFALGVLTGLVPGSSISSANARDNWIWTIVLGLFVGAVFCGLGHLAAGMTLLKSLALACGCLVGTVVAALTPDDNRGKKYFQRYWK